MNTPSRGFKTFLLLISMTCGLCGAGLIKGNRDDDSVETLLAVGLIAKALSDVEAPPRECPPPVHVTKIVEVPVHKERVIVVKDKNCDAHRYHESKQIWRSAVPTKDPVTPPPW